MAGHPAVKGMAGIMTTARRLLGDMGRLCAGTGVLLHNATFSREPRLSLAGFVPEQSRAVRGRANAYEIVIYNDRRKGCWVRLVLDLYAADNPQHPQGHFGFFAKRVYLRPCRSETVRIAFDWRETLRFEVQGVAFEPDGHGAGPCREPGRYRLTAALLTAAGRSVETLAVVQEMTDADR